MATFVLFHDPLNTIPLISGVITINADVRIYTRNLLFRVYLQASRADFSLKLKLRRRDLSELRLVYKGQPLEQVEIHVGQDQVGWESAKATHSLLSPSGTTTSAHRTFADAPLDSTVACSGI
jgi:hypothetical protein